jgi:hypothetical protein
MNRLELQMVDVLKELKHRYGAISVKAEFEAEGTRLEELLRLKEISMTAGLGLTMKIGGCESIRDLLEARTVGVNCLVAPMIESAYALQKYLQAIHKVFPSEEIENIEILCNIETISANKNFEEMLTIPEISILTGIVIERVDLCFSLGLDDNSINNKEINELVLKIITEAKNNNLLCVIGGGVSAHSLQFFHSIPESYLDRYETRKICFDCSKSLNNEPEKGILKALEFELLWLKNKLSYFEGITSADKQRMTLIEQRYLKTINTLI